MCVIFLRVNPTVTLVKERVSGWVRDRGLSQGGQIWRVRLCLPPLVQDLPADPKYFRASMRRVWGRGVMFIAPQ